MTADRSIDQRIADWLLEEAPTQLPDRVLQATFERTRPARQRRVSVWSRPSSVHYSSRAWLVVGAFVIVFAIAGAVIVPRLIPVGTQSTPTPTSTSTTLVTPSVSPGETAEPLSGQVAFSRTLDGNTDIYLVNTDGSGLARLTTDAAEDLEPTWLADGRTLVFTRRTSVEPDTSELYAVDVDSRVETALTVTGARAADPKLSPNGQQIAYEGTPPGIFVMQTDGSGEHQVFAFDAYYTLLGWSLDSRSLYIRREADGAYLRLAIATGSVVEEPSAARFAGPLSPDGARIAFEQAADPGGLWVMARDGTNATHVFGDWTQPYGVAWAPDSEHLLFAQGDGWLYLVALDGTGLARWAEGINPAPRPEHP